MLLWLGSGIALPHRPREPPIQQRIAFLGFHLSQPPVQSLSLARLTRIRAERVPHPRGNPVEDTLPFQAAIRYATGIYYPRIADAPTSAFIAARKVLSPGFYEPQPVSEHLCSSTPQKPYRQQSLLTKQRTRLTRLRTRLLIKTPLFFFEAYQEKLSENPEYYGVCVIEGALSHQPRSAARLDRSRESDRPRKRTTCPRLVVHSTSARPIQGALAPIS